MYMEFVLLKKKKHLLTLLKKVFSLFFGSCSYFLLFLKHDTRHVKLLKYKMSTL